MKQAVRITTSPTIFGHRPYFTCTCGRRGKLYLRPGIDFWQCRRCLNLRYEVQRMSKKSCIGLLGYYLNRQMKISWMAGEIKRIEYGGKLTRRARALVQKSRKWKLNDQTKGRIEILKPG